MPMKMPKHVFTIAALNADVRDQIDLVAADQFENVVFSQFCPALKGSTAEFHQLFGQIVHEMTRSVAAFDSEDVMDLAERIVIVPVEDGSKLFGFSGLELTD